MKFSDLIKGLKDYGSLPNTSEFDGNAQISGVTDNTELCGKGFIFVCIKGRRFDGHTAAARMLSEKGAFCIVTDHDLGLEKQIIVENTRKFYGQMTAAWYNHPERKMVFAGVTGTNGKTTTASLLAQVLVSGGQTVGLIGTTGVFIMDAHNETKIDAPENTTPPVSEFYRILAEMSDKNVTTVVMEVSSFALEQERIGPLIFDVTVFTNLTQDHLDYHGTMEDYYEAKKKLFTEHSKVSLINTDDSFGVRLFTELNQAKTNNVAGGKNGTIYAYGTSKGCPILIENVTLDPDHTRFRMEAGGVMFIVSTCLVGEYNVYNTAAAIAAANVLGMGINSVVRSVSKAKGAAGRCEVIPCSRGFTVICDYAHTPDALTKVCSALKRTTRGRLITVFGCGGDRDADKRPKMGRAAQEYSDVVIVTSDNPRNEDPDDIIDHIINGMDSTKPIVRITDRKAAICYAISEGRQGDVILLAGKGHETYQIFADGFTIPFDERRIVADMLARYSAPLPKDKGRGDVVLSIATLNDFVYGSMHDIRDINRDVFVSAIFTDAQAPVRGGVYVAVKSDSYDGHDFIPAAMDAGAMFTIAERIVPGYPSIIVKNTKSAMLDIARYCRKQHDILTVGVTGSAGKTITKDMIALALSCEKTVFKTEINQSNEVGVATAMFGLNSSYNAAVIEMGMSRPGEILKLSNAVQPDICLITNIGYNHIENFDSQVDILNEKLEILNGAAKNAPFVINGSDPMLMSAQEIFERKHKIVTFGWDGDFDYNAIDLKHNGSRVSFRVTKHGEYISDVELFDNDSYNVMNALAAVTIADLAGVDAGTAGQMIGCYQPPPLRSHIEKRGQNTLIVDCYSASPASMESSIKMLAQMPIKPGARRVAVLGDMLEDGEDAQKLHEQVGELVVKNGIDLLVCYGEKAKYIAQKADELGMHSGYSADKNVVKNFLKFKLKPDDVILFKAARSMHLETLIDEFFS
jgi:UDP-N-acetylmuramyl-tripeptide synthetase/UDP-N-acetylmuramoyl-tripeptide--D-alanyl-D-alanine ligase